MIQRIQSIYLSIVIVISIFLFFLPLGVFISKSPGSNVNEVGNQAYKLSVCTLSKSVNGTIETVSVSYPLISFNLLVGLLSGMALFMYKNRKNQILLCRISGIIICLFALFIFWYEDQLKTVTGGDITYLIGSYLPVVQLIVVYLASHAIKKDEELIKSADRLR